MPKEENEKSVMIFDIPAEIRTEHLPNTTQKRYHLTSLLCQPECKSLHQTDLFIDADANSCAGGYVESVVDRVVRYEGSFRFISPWDI
jgi:hypothetical protein